MRYPITTTAQALKNPKRSHRLIQLAAEAGFQKVRFSVLSLTLLHRLFEEFTAEELIHVDVIPLNEGSTLGKRASGRARDRYKAQAQKVGQVFEDLPSQTIACVSGFLLNMVDRSIKLISPCTSSDRWPLGYYTFDQATFTDAVHLESIIQKMMDDHMSLSVPLHRPLQFRRDLRYESLADGFRLWTEYGQHTFSKNPFFQELGEMIKKGDRTGEDIAHYFLIEYTIKNSIVLEWLDLLFQQGVLNEEPQQRTVSTAYA